MTTQETESRTPTIDRWIGATVEAYRRGIWQRPEGAVYAGMDELLAEHGQAFTYDGRELPDDVLPGKMGECYANAGRMALFSSYRYVEGYAKTGDIPMPVRHAWLIDADGFVLDPTWTDGLEESRGGDNDGREYFGLIIPTTRLNDVVHRRKVWGVLDDHGFYTEEWNG